MKLLKKVKELIEKYPPRYFISLFKRFIENMISSIRNAGNSSWRFLLIFPLFLCIIILQILLIIKTIIKNIYDIFIFILKLIRKIFIVLLEELNFYWLKLKEWTKNLFNTLVIINKKLIEYIDHQIKKLLYADKYYYFTYENENIWKLLLNVLLYILICTIWIIFSTVMSIILILGTGIIIVPFFHKWIRTKVFKIYTIDD